MLTNYFPEHVGGVESVGAALAAGYRASGAKVHWLAAGVTKAPHVGPSDDVSLRAWNVTELRFGFPLPLPGAQAALEIWRQVRWSAVVHLHDSLYPANILALIIARAYRKPVIVTQHIRAGGFKSSAVRVLQWLGFQTAGRVVLSSADRVAFVSRDLLDAFHNWRFRAPVEVIENPLDTSVFYPEPSQARPRLRRSLGLSSDRPIALFVGRFVDNKGIHEIRTAARQTHDWSWVLVGRGDVDPQGWGLANVLVVPPMPRERLRGYYAAADLLVLLSRQESFGLAVQEALACGTPALTRPQVAHVLGYPPHVYQADPDAEGFLAELRAAMTRARDDEERRSAASYAVQRWARNSIERYLEILGDLVAQGE